MGSRDRRDASHKARAKGAPTPTAPQNNHPPAVPGTPPPTRAVAWIMGAQAQIGTHDGIAGDILSLHLVIPGGVLTVKMPLVGGWDAVTDVVAAAKDEYEQAARAAAAQIHLPGGVDLAAEAKALEQLRKGPDHA